MNTYPILRVHARVSERPGLQTRLGNPYMDTLRSVELTLSISMVQRSIFALTPVTLAFSDNIHGCIFALFTLRMRNFYILYFQGSRLHP